MSKFKVGDKVVCIDPGCNFLTAGKEYTVTGHGQMTSIYVVNDRENNTWYYPNRFELIKENVHMFDLKKERWFIRTPTPEISKLVQEWLFEQGFEWYSSGKSVKHLYEPYIGNSRHEQHCLVMDLMEPHSTRKEIKLTFKTIVDSVEYPETVTPEQQKLASLIAHIEQFKAEAQQLQAIINKGKM